jgi:hypothetical protein
MHTYIQNNQHSWSVIFEQNGTRRMVREFNKERDAAAYASYLNGGVEPAFVPPLLAKKPD